MDTRIHSTSFLITHYNRPDDLLKCITAIKVMGLENYEIVVSDDNSDKDILLKIKMFPIDNLIEASKNEGLAANINKGILACKGDFILYCQEDFILNEKIKKLLPECIDLLQSRRLDLIRFTSYFKFNTLKNLSASIDLIPKFTFKNFTQNFYRYSDHPFIVKNDFYNKYGMYLEGTSGRYGETEYSMRISNTNAKIGISKEYLARNIEGSESILINEFKSRKNSVKIGKPIKKYLRAFRLYFEWLCYNKKKRGLITYKNARKTVR